MFTGIITATGTVARAREETDVIRLDISFPPEWLADSATGDSIAVDGACLTIVKKKGDEASFQLSPETLQRTISFEKGKVVNLEKALGVTQKFDGHIVTGHVDGVGKVLSVTKTGECLRIIVKAPEDLERYIATKGSITIDGVSLTVNEISNEGFAVQIVPHTAKHTTLGKIAVEKLVNIEVDIIARYLESLLRNNNSSGA